MIRKLNANKPLNRLANGLADQSHPITVTVTTTATTSISSTSVPTTSATNLITNYGVTPANEVYDVALDCGSLATTLQTTNTYNNVYNDNYKVYCGVDFGNAPSTNPDAAPVIDLLGIVAYRLTDCLEACSALNYRSMSNNFIDSYRCQSVSFNSRLAEQMEILEGNCWLKNGIPANISDLKASSENFLLSAALQS